MLMGEEQRRRVANNVLNEETWKEVKVTKLLWQQQNNSRERARDAGDLLVARIDQLVNCNSWQLLRLYAPSRDESGDTGTTSRRPQLKRKLTSLSTQQVSRQTAIHIKWRTWRRRADVSYKPTGKDQFKPIGTVDQNSDLASRKWGVDTQKCIRADGKHSNFNDVGKDVYHHKFFKMLDAEWHLAEFAIRWGLHVPRLALDQSSWSVSWNVGVAFNGHHLSLTVCDLRSKNKRNFEWMLRCQNFKLPATEHFSSSFMLRTIFVHCV